MNADSEDEYYTRDAEIKRVLGQEVVYAPELAELPSGDARPRGRVVDLVDYGSGDALRVLVVWDDPQLGTAVERAADLLVLGDRATQARREIEFRRGLGPGRLRPQGG